MKYILYIFLIILCSCHKDFEIEEPTLDIKVDNPTATMSGDTINLTSRDLINFRFTGDADLITFYSGETGSNYAYSERVSEKGLPRVTFTLTQSNAGQPNTLRMYASTDFNGIYDTTSVKAATWVDITSKFTIPTGNVTGASAANNVSLAEFDDGKPFYFAYRYIGKKSITQRQPTWVVPTFAITNLTNDGKLSDVVANVNQLAFSFVDFSNTTRVWTGVNTITFSGPAIGGDPANDISDDDNDDWAISRPLDLRRTLPDLGTPIKKLGDLPITLYNRQYLTTVTAVFNVAFVAKNVSKKESKEVVKKFIFRITP